MLSVRRNFNTEVGKVVWTVERENGEVIGGKAGMAVGLNFENEDAAFACLFELKDAEMKIKIAKMPAYDAYEGGWPFVVNGS